MESDHSVDYIPLFMSINSENLQTCTTSAAALMEYSQKTGTSVCTNMHQPAPLDPCVCTM